MHLIQFHTIPKCQEETIILYKKREIACLNTIKQIDIQMELIGPHLEVGFRIEKRYLLVQILETCAIDLKLFKVNSINWKRF